eukprot:CAMPEP_0173411668 /NCGR_PEP_ID=MMETSP1356-20130122/77623_1 /TAXON_ID=77927 ORGANISM="Hemiselmis virescens, Strain PCC157" /NCGR_SAMPLE_ID=MMETSP1356 /ASSEMBLY_ACC=CAM_ASM_000847 /LENGTH=195 /DNA_ID=CAMNT_0014373457 /DNA_START=79 /DNA_END=663 /DNA_ORIENTATION=-
MMRAGALKAKTLADSGSSFKFGRFSCKATQLFFSSPLCIGFVNLRPILPGHVLISPTRVVSRVADLTDEELCELWRAARHTAVAMERHLGAEGLNMAIQDGEAAGQSVPHVHVHLIPRKGGDLARNDEIYERMEDFDGRPREEASNKDTAGGGGEAPGGGSAKKMKLHVPPDSERVDRSEADMEREAGEMRDILL